MGHGEVEAKVLLSPTGLSTAQAANGKVCSRLDINKAVDKLIWELKGWANMLLNWSWFSTRDRISRGLYCPPQIPAGFLRIPEDSQDSILADVPANLLSPVGLYS